PSDTPRGPLARSRVTISLVDSRNARQARRYGLAGAHESAANRRASRQRSGGADPDGTSYANQWSAGAQRPSHGACSTQEVEGLQLPLVGPPMFLRESRPARRECLGFRAPRATATRALESYRTR